jgi:hypothetical protein
MTTDISIPNEALTRRLVVHLIHRYVEWTEAFGPSLRSSTSKAVQIAEARFDEAAQTAHFALQLQGIEPGSAPASVRIDIHSATNRFGPPPTRGMAHNDEYLAWQTGLVDFLITKWIGDNQ